MAESEPVATRNRLGEKLAESAFFTNSAPVEQLIRLESMTTSGELQDKLLEGWIKGHTTTMPDRNWISDLPTGKLREKALNLTGR